MENNKQESTILEIKEKLLLYIYRREKKIQKRIQNISNDLEKFKKYIIYQKYGELIKYHLSKIKKGISSISLYDWESNKNLIIPLKEEYSPEENMNYYFKKSKKLKKGIEIAQKRLEESNKELQKLQQEKIFIEHTESEEELKELLTKYEPNKPNFSYVRRVKKQLGKIYLYKDHLFYVGRNAKENEELLKYVGGGNDWWFHIRDYPGSYVICITGKKGEINYDLVKFGATLALINSKAAKSNNEEVVYTQKKYVKFVPHGKTGQVLYTNEKTIRIKKEIDVSNYKIQKDFLEK